MVKAILPLVAVGVIALLWLAAREQPSRSDEIASNDMTTAGLIAIIRSADFVCDDATSVFRQGETGGSVYWNARCSNGAGYAVSVNGAGQTSVIECEVLPRVTGIECFSPLR